MLLSKLALFVAYHRSMIEIRRAVGQAHTAFTRFLFFPLLGGPIYDRFLVMWVNSSLVVFINIFTAAKALSLSLQSPHKKVSNHTVQMPVSFYFFFCALLFLKKNNSSRFLTLMIAHPDDRLKRTFSPRQVRPNGTHGFGCFVSKRILSIYLFCLLLMLFFLF